MTSTDALDKLLSELEISEDVTTIYSSRTQVYAAPDDPRPLVLNGPSSQKILNNADTVDQFVLAVDLPPGAVIEIIGILCPDESVEAFKKEGFEVRVI